MVDGVIGSRYSNNLIESFIAMTKSHGHDEYPWEDI